MDKDFEEWQQRLYKMDFDTFVFEMKDKVLNSNMDKESKQQFSDCFDYVYKLYKNNKPLEPNLLKIYLEQIKGYKNISVEGFIRILVLLDFCGFHIRSLETIKNNNKIINE